MRKVRALVVAVAVMLAVVGASGTAADAAGFEELTVEEAGENTSTCDFDGDGVFTDYVVTPGQTIRVLSTTHIDGQGITHGLLISEFDSVEYTFPGATPDAIYITTRNVIRVTADGDTLLTFSIRSYGFITDADGNLLAGPGPGHVDVEWVDGVPMLTYPGPAAGLTGPCAPGFVTD